MLFLMQHDQILCFYTFFSQCPNNGIIKILKNSIFCYNNITSKLSLTVHSVWNINFGFVGNTILITKPMAKTPNLKLWEILTPKI